MTCIPQIIRNSFRRNPSRIIGQENMELIEEQYTNFLKNCVQTCNLQHGKAVHAQIVKGFLISSLFLLNHLLNMYCKLGDLVGAYQLFDQIPERNVVSWSAIIGGFVQHGQPKNALSFFRKMQSSCVEPNEFTLVSVLNACSLLESSTFSHQIYARVVRLGFESNLFLMNSFLTSLIRHGKFTEAVEFFDKCKEKDIVSWNAMISGYLQYSYADVWWFWCDMIYKGLKPDNFTFSTVLTGLATSLSLRNGSQVHTQLIKYGYEDDVCVGNSLVDMYLKSGCFKDGLKVFNEIERKDVVSWTQMSSEMLQCGQPDKALEVIRRMRDLGINPNKFTIATMVNACANMASIEEGKKVHGLKIKLGDDMDICVDNALLDMYAKCGCMNESLILFKSMKNRTLVSWTTMIMGFAQNGQACISLKIFDEMILSGVEPNHITFICVLYACSQSGFIEEGWKYFSSMYNDYGLIPKEDHYACMVDLLGKAGRIKEAESLIHSMPVKPCALVWQTLLGACRIHGDVETGKRAAKNALVLDKKDPSTYLLLSNIHADSNNWDSVGQLREVMVGSQVRKVPGCSWVETGTIG